MPPPITTPSPPPAPPPPVAAPNPDSSPTCNFEVKSLLNGSTGGRATSIWRCSSNLVPPFDFIAFADGTAVTSAIGQVKWSQESCGTFDIQGSVPQKFSDIVTSSEGESATFKMTQGESVGTVSCTRNVKVPEPRRGHHAVFDANRNQMVIFGGAAKFGPHGYMYAMSDTWEYDGVRWSLVDSEAPRGYIGAKMAYDLHRSRVVMLTGGLNQSVSATWEYDGTKWERVSTPTAPSNRGYHAMTYDPLRRVVVLFGGSPNANGAGVTLYDTWEYDGATWSKKGDSDGCKPSTTVTPCVSYNAGMTFDTARGVPVLVGRGSDSLAKTWTWDGSVWRELLSEHVPVIGGYPLLTYDALRGRTVFVGPQIWEWTGADWIYTGHWPPRLDTSAVYHSGIGATLIFGGYSGETFFNDVQRWDGVTLTGP